MKRKNASLLGNVLMGLGSGGNGGRRGVFILTSYHSLICPSISHMVQC